MIDEIDQAQCSVDLFMYLFTEPEVLNVLEHAVDRGIRVRVILEKSPFGTFGDQQEMFDRLVGIGAEVRWSPGSFTYGHAKYMIVDSVVLLVTNQNFTGAGFNRNREFGVVTTEPHYVAEAAMIFEADWTESLLQDDIEHLVVSPMNSREIVLDLINSSQRSVWMYSEVLRDEEVTEALSAAAERGVDVRILVNPTADEDDVPYFLDALRHGVQIRVLRNPYVHSKAMVVDGSIALVGSHNYSYTSLDLNREVGMLISDPANLSLITSVFAQDWSRAEPVDSISRAEPTEPFALTQQGWIGRITCVRWRVV